MNRRDRELGMDRAINRRDFISGVGVALTGSLLYPWAEAHSQSASSLQAGYYPPGKTGMRGSHVGSFEVAHELRDGKTWDELGPEANTGERYHGMNANMRLRITVEVSIPEETMREFYPKFHKGLRKRWSTGTVK